MSKKRVMNAGICCICTAVIFGLHFCRVRPDAAGQSCAGWRYLRCFYCSSRRAQQATGPMQRNGTPPTAYLRTRLCQLIWSADCLSPYRYILVHGTVPLSTYWICTDLLFVATLRIIELSCI